MIDAPLDMLGTLELRLPPSLAEAQAGCCSSCKWARTQSDAAAGRVPLEERRGAPVAVGQVRHHKTAAHLHAPRMDPEWWMWRTADTAVLAQLAMRLRLAKLLSGRAVVMWPSCWVQNGVST